MLRVVGERPVGSRHARYAGRAHRLDRGHLVAHEPDRLRLRADEDEAAFLDALREVRVLGQKSVAWVNRDGVRDLRGRDDGGHIEVTLLRARWLDADGLVREEHVLQRGVGGRVHGHRLDAELTAGAEDAKSNLAAVGDQDFIERR